MTNEQLRMQMLAGIITEGEYKAKLNENIDLSLQNNMYVVSYEDPEENLNGVRAYIDKDTFDGSKGDFIRDNFMITGKNFENINLSPEEKIELETKGYIQL